MSQAEALCRSALDGLQRILPTDDAVAAIDSGQLRTADVSSGLSYGSPLAGKLIGIKDMIDVAGMATKCGSRLSSASVKSTDADVVKCLRRAGALPAIKTVTHEFAYGPTADIAASGPVSNPHDPTRMAGGSSGGSAALLAAGKVGHALGTDTGGSGRTPAAWCGVFGLRPTLGAISSAGVFPLAPSFDSVSPMATSIRGLTDLWNVLSSGRATSRKINVSDSSPSKLPSIGTLSTGIWAQVVPEIQLRINERKQILRHLGYTIVELADAWTQKANRLYPIIVGYEALQIHGRNVVDRPESFQPEVLDRLKSAEKTSSGQYLDALAELADLRSRVDEQFDGTDFLLCPTSPVGAQSIFQRRNFDAGLSTVFDVALAFTAPFSVLGVPALSMPVGVDGRGMPIGMQLIGKPNSEPRLLELAGILSEASGSEGGVSLQELHR